MPKKSYIAVNVIIAVLCFVLQYNRFNLFKFMNASPMFPLGFLIILSMFLSELSSFVWGVLFGIIVDSFSTTALGFNSIIFPLFAFLVSFIVHYLFNNNIMSSAVLTVSCCLVYFTVRFLIFFPSVSAKDTLSYIIRAAIPSAIITAVFSVLLYLFEKKIFKNQMAPR
ncbi:MAG: rod shape-determining protein MreD [Clostridia bacterium]|nr:rod shape-determining protein MreD [Clostridia bacterium]